MSSVSKLLQRFPEINDGLFQSRLKGVRLFQETKPIPRQPMIYDPSICIIVQGEKPGI